MDDKKNWMLKGIFYECCRVEDGHCGLWFGRDLPMPCANLVTYQITQGQIENVDMKDVVILLHQDGIGPKFTDMVNGADEGAAYISDNTDDAQRKVLTTFLETELGIRPWKRLLGIKVVKIDIRKTDSTYHITMPFGEQKMTLTVGKDQKTPMRMENPRNPAFSNLRFCHTDTWKYHDYGKELVFYNASGMINDFVFKP